MKEEKNTKLLEKVKTKVQKTIEECQLIINKVNPNIILLERILNADRLTFKYQCECGNISIKSFSLLKKGQKCIKCSACRMIKFNDAQQILNKNNINVELINTYPKYGATWCTFKCSCGNVHSKRFSELLVNPVCNKCGYKNGANKRTYDINFIKNELLNINKNIEILDNEYINSKAPLVCKCKIDNNEWITTWANLKNKRGCPVCNGRLSIDDVINRLNEINPNIEILSSDYSTCRTKITCKCNIDGKIWKSDWAKLSKGSGCPVCGGCLKLNIEEVKNKLRLINPKIEIVDDYYINSKNKMKCKCKICGNTWMMSFSSLSLGHGCPNCHLINNSGINHHNWKGGVSNLSEFLRNSIKIWKIDSFKFYKNKSDISGIKQKNNVIHHLYNFSIIVNETLLYLKLKINKHVNEYSSIELDELIKTCVDLHYKHGLGVCLTKEEHDEFHRLYNKSNNTLEQYYEFKEIKQRELGIII